MDFCIRRNMKKTGCCSGFLRVKKGRVEGGGGT